MFLTYLMLAVALCLSAVAAFYSIVGLTAIFAASVIPIVIMGSILEVAKLVITVWLHEYWPRVKWVMRLYLIPAVAALMFITSMGIFGFLSQAHIEQAGVSQENAAQIQRITAELARQQDIVARAEERARTLETTGTGADANVNNQIRTEQERIDAALARVQPAIDEQNKIIDAQTKIYQDQITKIDQQSAQLQGFIDAKEITKAQALVGTAVDGNWGPGTAAAVRTWQAARARERTDAVTKLEQASVNPTIQAARSEIARIRKTVETQVTESNRLIDRLRNQLASGSTASVETLVDEQQKRIKAATEEIETLTQKKYQLEAEYRRLEVEVGPIKYIAELIYGDTDTDLLEKAVRWVIILIVAVFDPLAVMMLLAATESRGWVLTGRRKTAPPEPEVTPETLPEPEVPTEPRSDVLPEEEPSPLSYTNGYTAVMPTVQSVDIVTQPPVPAEPPQKENTIKSGLIPVERDFPPPELNEDEHDIAHEKDELIKAAKRAWKDEHPDSTLKEQRRLFELGQIDHLPWEDYLHAAANTSFGPVSPAAPKKGQLFLRTDVVPTRLYKYNGQKWIEVNKDLTDQYVFDDAYIEFLMDKIVNGEYDQDLLTEAERNQIESRLK
jgi:hypothetical protein